MKEENISHQRKEKQMSGAKKLMTDWLLAKEQEKSANERRLKIEIELYKIAMKSVEIKKEGTTNFEDDGVKLVITSKMSVKVDQDKAALHPDLFAVKYEFSKTKNKGLTKEQLQTQLDIVVTTPAKPTFEVKVL